MLCAWKKEKRKELPHSLNKIRVLQRSVPHGDRCLISPQLRHHKCTHFSIATWNGSLAVMTTHSPSNETSLANSLISWHLCSEGSYLFYKVAAGKLRSHKHVCDQSGPRIGCSALVHGTRNCRETSIHVKKKTRLLYSGREMQAYRGGDKKLLWQSPAIQLRPCTTARTQCAHYLTCNDQHAPPCCRGFDAGCHFECLTDVGAEQNCNLASVITGLSICSYRPVLGSFVTNIIAVFNLKWQEAAERDKEHHNAF